MIEFLDPQKNKNSDINRKAETFNKIILGTMAMVIILEVIFVILVPQQYTRWLFIALSYTAITAILIFLNKKGHFYMASIIFICFMGLLLFGLSWTGGGIKAPVVFTIPVLVLIAGLLLGWGAGLVAGIIIILLGTAMVIAEHLGIISGRTINQQPITVLVIFIFTVSLLIILQYLSTTNLNKALTDAREELKRRKITEKELQNRESHIRSISKNLTDGMIYQVVIRPDGTRKFTYLSDSVIQLYGITPEEAMNNADLIYSRIHEEDFPRVKELEDRAAASLSVFKAEFRAFNPSGDLRWSSCISNPTLMYDGSVRFDGIEFIITEHKLTEERLAASEASYRFIAEKTDDVIWSLNLQTGKYSYVSPSVKKLRGYTPEEVMNQTMAEILTPDSLEKALSMIEEVIQQQKPGDPAPQKRTLELNEFCRDGSIIYTEISATMIFNEQGKPLEIIGVTRDITERKKAEEALRKSEERYKLVTELATDYVFKLKITADGKVIMDFLSDNYYTITGRTTDEAANLDLWTSFIHPEDIDMVFSTLHKLTTSPDTAKIECRSYIHSNQMRWIIVIAKSQWDEKEKKITSITGAVNDITERKEAEAALIESEHKARAILDISFEFLGVLTPDGTVIDANQTALNFAGIQLTDVVGRPFWETPWWSHSKEIQNHLKKEVQNAASGQTVHFETTHPAKDGSIHVIDFSLRPMKDEEGQVIMLIPEGHDITERKNAEQQIKASLREKETLLRELYHRTKNNMQVISAMVNLSVNKIHDTETMDLIKDIDSKIHTMSLVHKKLYESRDLSHINLKEYLEELSSYLSTFYRTLSEGLTISVNGDNIFLLIDIAIPLGMVLNEMITNALKYAFPRKRGGNIQISLNQDDENKTTVTVADNGVGLPDGFDINNNASLGLQTATAIVEQQLQGDINFKSDRDRGTMWTITFNTDLYRQRI